jgi:hypothetical protein
MRSTPGGGPSADKKEPKNTNNHGCNSTLMQPPPLPHLERAEQNGSADLHGGGPEAGAGEQQLQLRGCQPQEGLQNALRME